jgi:hypothetical protein
MDMKRLILAVSLLLSLLSGAPFARAARLYSQAELDALLAPVALYPDAVVRQVLDAAQYPGQVTDAARGIESPYYAPSVQALRDRQPELLRRMADSPHWLLDLGSAWMVQSVQVMQTIAALRLRAQAQGYSPPLAYTQPPPPVPLAYYNPQVVYGTWWWPAYRPVHYWRTWRPRPVIVTNVYVARTAPLVVHPNGAASPAAQLQAQQSAAFVARTRPAATTLTVTPYVKVPESRRQAIVQSHANPPSPAAQLQAQQSAAFIARAQAANKPIGQPAQQHHHHHHHHGRKHHHDKR